MVKGTTSLGQAEVKFADGVRTVPIKSLNPLESKRSDFPPHMRKVFAI